MTPEQIAREAWPYGGTAVRRRKLIDRIRAYGDERAREAAELMDRLHATERLREAGQRLRVADAELLAAREGLDEALADVREAAKEAKEADRTYVGVRGRHVPKEAK